MSGRTTGRKGKPSQGTMEQARVLLVMALLACIFAPAEAAAHADGFIAPGDLWRSWTLDPWVAAGVVVPAWLYFRGVRRRWERAGKGSGIREWQAWSFAAGIAALAIALMSPLDSLGGALFSAHMLQHVVLMMVAAPLLVLGNPIVAFVWGLPMRSRKRVGGWARNPDVRGIWYVVSHPVAAWLLHAVAIWVWHVPVLYEATLTSELVHFAQHGAFVGTALLFWYAAFEFGRRRRLRHGLGTVYVFTTALHSSILAALLTFSMTVWYPIYAERSVVWGLAPLEDQQLGGLVMWVPAGVIYLVAALALLALGLGVGAAESAPRTAGYGDARPLPLLERSGSPARDAARQANRGQP
jgi:putative membrane protein